MSSYIETVPQWILDGDGELEVRFEWTPGTPEFIPPANRPEDYDPGSGDEFIIRSAAYIIDGKPMFPCGLSDTEEQRVIDWLDGEWERPDHAAAKADYLYDQWRDEQMEKRA